MTRLDTQLGHRLLAAGHSIATLTVRLPGALAALRAVTADGYPSGGEASGEGHTSTEAAVLARQRADRIRRDLLDASQALVDWCNRMHNLLDEAVRAGGGHDLADVKAKTRCTGGAPSLEAWTRPECDNVVGERSEHGLCDACRQRRDHWRKRQTVSA